MATDDRTDHDIADLTDLWSVAAQAYLDGDLPRYAALANHPPDSPSPRRTVATPAEVSTCRTRPSSGRRTHSAGETWISRFTRRTPRVVSRS